MYVTLSQNFNQTLVIAEQETGVDTKIIEVDFLDDFVITESIMDVVKSIDVGILGKHCCLIVQWSNEYDRGITGYGVGLKFGFWSCN